MGCGGSTAAGTVFPGEASPKQGDSPKPNGSEAQAAAKAGLQPPLSAPLLASLQARRHSALLAANEGAPKGPPSNETPTKLRKVAISNIDKSELVARQLAVRQQLNGSMATVLRRRRSSFAEVYPIRTWLNSNPLNPETHTVYPKP